MKKQFLQKTALLLLLLLFLSSQALNAQTFTPLNVGKNIKIQGVAFYNETEGYMCGDSGMIFKINPDKITSPITTPTRNPLWRIAVIPQTQGQGFIAVGENNTVLKSTDGGTTIQTLSIPQAANSFVFGVHCIDINTYYICGGDFGSVSGTILKTTDGGATWAKTDLQSTSFMDNLFFVSPSEGYAVGGGQLSGAVYKTINAGATWLKVLTTPALMVNVYAYDENKAIAVGLGGQVYSTPNGGRNWADNSQGNLDFFGARFISEDIGYICGGDVNNSVLYRTNDGGASWTSVNVPQIGSLWNLAITNSVVAIVGSVGSWAIGESPRLSSPNLQTPTLYVYPNPATNSVFVELEDEDSYTVNLCSIDGKVLSSTTINQHKTAINTSQLAKGIYLLVLQNSEGIKHTQKLLID